MRRPAPSIFRRLFETANAFRPLTAVAVSRSSTVGASWGDPVTAVGKDALTHFLDKDWMTLDPTNNRRIYVTYTDFDTTGDLCGFSAPGAAIARFAIELVRSDDEGSTWGRPIVVDEVCTAPPDFPVVEVPQVAIGPLGEVYSAWETYSGPASAARQIDIRKSTTHGDSFGQITKATDVIQVGDGSALQGGFRSNEFPMLAIDFHLTSSGMPSGSISGSL